MLSLGEAPDLEHEKEAAQTQGIVLFQMNLSLCPTSYTSCVSLGKTLSISELFPLL